MRRTPLCALVALMLCLPATAMAGPTPQPVIDDFSRIVRFGEAIDISGHVDNGSPGQVVELERRRPETEDWVAIDQRVLDKSLQAGFVLDDARRTSFYRMKVDETVSEEIRIRVRAKLTLSVGTKDLMERDATVLSGFLRPAADGRSVLLEQRVAGSWEPIGRALVDDGHYALPARFSRNGYRPVRATFQRDALNDGTRVQRTLRVHRPSLATWYGPGFFGNRTACGQRYTRHSVGIAHRKLPCGTNVHVLFGRETISLDVIDRGPYTDANWDLSQKAARRIGFYGKEDIGILIRR